LHKSAFLDFLCLPIILVLASFVASTPPRVKIPM